MWYNPTKFVGLLKRCHTTQPILLDSWKVQPNQVCWTLDKMWYNPTKLTLEKMQHKHSDNCNSGSIQRFLNIQQWQSEIIRTVSRWSLFLQFLITLFMHSCLPTNKQRENYSCINLKDTAANLHGHYTHTILQIKSLCQRYHSWKSKFLLQHLIYVLHFL